MSGGLISSIEKIFRNKLPCTSESRVDKLFFFLLILLDVRFARPKSGNECQCKGQMSLYGAF